MLIGAMALFASCDTYETPDPTAYKNDSISAGSLLYVNQYDAFADKGQYTLPKLKMGKSYYVVQNAGDNTIGKDGLGASLLAESLIGLTACAVNEDRGSTMIWTEQSSSEYLGLEQSLGLTNNGAFSALALLDKPEIRSVVKGYVLCQSLREEGISAATVAAHVHQAVICISELEDTLKNLGYTMLYDARTKTPVTAWAEFKDKCSNNGLVLMPTLTANNKAMVIAHRWFFVNYNKKYNNPNSGNNANLYNEVLAWLKPMSPVIGWEQGLGENVFVAPVSQAGCLMMPADWCYNMTLSSANYQNRQQGLAGVLNPRYINFDSSKSYVSFILSDGDNVQWMLNGFRGNRYYSNPQNFEAKMSFGIPVVNLAMTYPGLLGALFNEQIPASSVMEFGGGGYAYVDIFGASKSNRAELLQQQATIVGNHMRQHRVKVLGLFALNDVKGAAAQESYEQFIKANDQLEGIVALQYDPYNGGHGEILWFQNAKGHHIPVVTVRYSLWNFGSRNSNGQGTPTYVSQQLNALAASTEEQTFSAVMVHAWSNFADTGDSADPLLENQNGTSTGASAAQFCTRRLNEKIVPCNTQELMWQIRMKYYPGETTEIINNYY